MTLYRILAVVTLMAHLGWILWVILGWLAIRNRPLLCWLHILSLLYSLVIEISPWPCPLTIAEQWLQGRAGIQPYRQPFLVHYLEALVYPNVSQTLLTWSAVIVCSFLLGLDALKFRQAAAARGQSSR